MWPSHLTCPSTILQPEIQPRKETIISLSIIISKSISICCPILTRKLHLRVAKYGWEDAIQSEAWSALCKYLFLWPVENAKCNSHNGFSTLTWVYCAKRQCLFYHKKWSFISHYQESTHSTSKWTQAHTHKHTDLWWISVPTAIKKMNTYTVYTLQLFLYVTFEV